MIRLIILSVLFLSSLLVIFRAPTNLLWYLSILLTEFCWIFILLITLLLFWKFGAVNYYLPANIIGTVALLIFLLPILQASQVSGQLQKDFQTAFPTNTSDIPTPFHPLRMITGIGTTKVDYTTYTYDDSHQLALDFYPSTVAGKKALCYCRTWRFLGSRR